MNLLDNMVPKKGLEPPHPCEYVDLNHARLPIPPLRHGDMFSKFAEQAAISESRKCGNAVSNNQSASQAIALTRGFNSSTEHF